MKCVLAVLFLVLFTSSASAQVCELPSKCYSEQTRKEVLKALEELDNIYKSKVELKLQDPVIVIRDWDGRVYVNGGESNPLRLNLRLGPTIDRDIALVLKPRIHTREKPADPMFRLRLRAQVGVLARGTYERIANGGSWPIDGGLNLDFFHLGLVNFGVYAGIFSAGPQVGLDITRNFGVFTGYSLVYLKPKEPDLLSGIYFSFN